MVQVVDVDLMRVAKRIQRLLEMFGADRENAEHEFKDMNTSIGKAADSLGITSTHPRMAIKQHHCVMYRGKHRGILQKIVVYFLFILHSPTSKGKVLKQNTVIF